MGLATSRVPVSHTFVLLLTSLTFNEKALSMKRRFSTAMVQAKLRTGKVKYALAMWLLGLPLPIVLIALFWKGCDW